MHQKLSTVIPLYGAIAIMFFTIGFLTTVLVLHWDTVNALIFESNLAKYEIMSGQRGPATYLVFHSDFAALQSMADSSSEILGVEQHLGSNVAKMAFVSVTSPLIQTVAELPEVSDMINRNVPMLCH